MIFLLALIVPLSLNVSAETKSVLRVVKTTDAQSDKSKRRTKKTKRTKRRKTKRQNLKIQKKKIRKIRKIKIREKRTLAKMNWSPAPPLEPCPTRNPKVKSRKRKKTKQRAVKVPGIPIRIQMMQQRFGKWQWFGLRRDSSQYRIHDPAWNNLGMHCMDDDYDISAFYPPYNTVNAHLLTTGTSWKMHRIID